MRWIVDADKLSALRLFLKLHDDAVGLLQRTSFNMSVHENNVCLAVGLMQPAAVLVADIRLGEINDGRMVQEKGKVGDQQRVGRLANGTQPGSGAIGWLAGGIAGREIRRGVLVHPIADFPRVPVARIGFVVLPMVLQQAARTAKNADCERTSRSLGAGV